jgi:membrane protein implicated in regulation of membrane protease activity
MKILRDHSLTIVLAILSITTIGGMLMTGWFVYDHELAEHGSAQIGLGAYAASGHFLSSLFENWESEFLQMSAYVMLTAFLFQRGSAESKDPDEPSDQDEDPAQKSGDPNAPWPVRVGGWVSATYSYSLGIALALLFLFTFALHLRYSAQAESAEASMHGQAAISVLEHFGSAQFWFESLQNWQSEFLSTAVIVVLSIFLRFRGSPESKPVAAPHAETGG